MTLYYAGVNKAIQGREPGPEPDSADGALALEPMQKERERRRMGVYWSVAGKAKWKFWLRRNCRSISIGV
jgi:hypothetical protein